MWKCTRRKWLMAAGAGIAAGAWSGARAGEGDLTDDMVEIPAGPFLMGTTAGQAVELANKRCWPLLQARQHKVRTR